MHMNGNIHSESMDFFSFKLGTSYVLMMIFILQKVIRANVYDLLILSRELHVTRGK